MAYHLLNTGRPQHLRGQYRDLPTYTAGDVLRATFDTCVNIGTIGVFAGAALFAGVQAYEKGRDFVRSTSVAGVAPAPDMSGVSCSAKINVAPSAPGAVRQVATAQTVVNSLKAAGHLGVVLEVGTEGLGGGSVRVEAITAVGKQAVLAAPIGAYAAGQAEVYIMNFGSVDPAKLAAGDLDAAVASANRSAVTCGSTAFNKVA